MKKNKLLPLVTAAVLALLTSWVMPAPADGEMSAQEKKMMLDKQKREKAAASEGEAARKRLVKEYGRSKDDVRIMTNLEAIEAVKHAEKARKLEQKQREKEKQEAARERRFEEQEKQANKIKKKSEEQQRKALGGKTLEDTGYDEAELAMYRKMARDAAPQCLKHKGEALINCVDKVVGE